MQMKKFTTGLFFTLLITILLTGCSQKNELKEISDALSVDLSGGSISKSIDSHGGFHGDGITYTEIIFDKVKHATLLQEIKNTANWQRLPLTKNLSTAVYGLKSETQSVGPYVNDDDGKPLFPAMKNGYYFFYDRHSESSNPSDDTALFNRYSFNFTIAMYDEDTHTLHFYKLDT